MQALRLIAVLNQDELNRRAVLHADISHLPYLGLEIGEARRKLSDIALAAL
jgi:hypothetical protein